MGPPSGKAAEAKEVVGVTAAARQAPTSAGGSGVNEQEKNRAFWAANSARSRSRDVGVPIPFVASVQRADVITFSPEVWSNASSKMEFALVGFVFGLNPSLSRIRSYARLKWGGDSIASVTHLNDGVFLFKFKSKEQKVAALSEGPWMFDSRPLVLKPWSLDETYERGCVDALPVWIRLPGLKAIFTDLDMLGTLCSALGRPICTDGVTAEGSVFKYARVCIEMYVDQEFGDAVVYQDPTGNTHFQKVIYEWRPERCENCCHFGHTKEKCHIPTLEDMLLDLKRKEEKDKRDIVERLVKDKAKAHTGGLELCLPEEVGGDTCVAEGCGRDCPEDDDEIFVPETQNIEDEVGSKLSVSGGVSTDSSEECSGISNKEKGDFTNYLSKSAKKRAKKGKKDQERSVCPQLSRAQRKTVQRKREVEEEKSFTPSKIGMGSW